MAIDTFSKIDQQLAEPIQQFVTEGVSNLASAVSGPLKAAVTLWIIFQGIAIMRGLVNEPVLDFAVKAMKVVVIVALATQVSTYNEYVKNVFFEALPKEIGNALAGSGAIVPNANAFDSFVQKGYQSAEGLWRQGGLTNPGPAFLGAFVMLIAGFGAVVAYTVSLYAKVALAIVLAVGPVFIALALFNSTKRFTESWLGQVVNYVVLQALVMVVLSLVLKVADKFAATSASADFGQAMMAALTMSVIYFWLPSSASSFRGSPPRSPLRVHAWPRLARSALLAMANVPYDKAEELLSIGPSAKGRVAAHYHANGSLGRRSSASSNGSP